MVEDDLQPVIVEFVPQPPQEPDQGQAAAAPVSMAESVKAIERLLRPDLCGILDNPFGDRVPVPTTRKAREAARLSPNFIRTAGVLAIKGFSDEEIAEAFGVGLAEVKTWEREYPDFKETLSRCKDVQDHIVERSLYNIATGYSHPAVDIKVDKDGIVTRTPYIEHYPPNLGACKEWLHNRRPDRWRPVGTDGEGIAAGQGGQGGRAGGVTVVLYSPHAQAQAVSIQAGSGGGSGGSGRADFSEGEGNIGGYGSRTYGGCSSATNSQKIKKVDNYPIIKDTINIDPDFLPENDLPPVSKNIKTQNLEE